MQPDPHMVFNWYPPQLNSRVTNMPAEPDTSAGSIRRSAVVLWRDPAFVVFWSARTLSYLGTGITNIVLPVLVYQLTGSATAVALVSGIEAVPYLALGLLAGAVADRKNRRVMMVTCDTACALQLAAVPAAAALHLLIAAQVFIVALGVATAFVWFDAANFGTLPALVERAQLPSATSLIGSTGTVAMLAGPTLGAAAIGLMGAPYALGLDAASYAMSAVLLISIRRPFRRPFRRPDQQPGPPKRIRTDMAEGLRYLWNHPVIRTMSLSVCCACMGWGGTFGLLVVYANRALGLTHVDVRLGLLYSAGELGGLVSVSAVPRLLRRLAAGRLIAAFLAADVLALALLSVAPSYIWAMVIFCCYELAYVMVTVTGVTVRQVLTPDHLAARVNTAGRMIAWGGQPAGALLAGLLVTVLPVRAVFGAMCACVAVGAGLAAWSCRGSGSFAMIYLPLEAPRPAGS
jgi:predicted MFS family arabinose efflux permease